MTWEQKVRAAKQAERLLQGQHEWYLPKDDHFYRCARCHCRATVYGVGKEEIDMIYAWAACKGAS